MIALEYFPLRRKIPDDTAAARWEDDNAEWAVTSLVAATCASDSALKSKQAEVAAVRERWSQKLEMNEADWADAVAYAGLSQWEKVPPHFKNGKKAWSALDPIDQWLALSENYGSSGHIVDEKNYVADALEPKLTALGRAGYVAKCLDYITQVQEVQWAMCAGDIARLDWAKVRAEMSATKSYEPADKMKLRFKLLELKKKIEEHAGKVKEVMAKDPGYAKIFEIAEKTRKQWDAGGVADPALINLALAMDDARITNSRSAFAGCMEKTWPAWRKAVAAIPAKEFEAGDQSKGFDAMGPIMNNPNAYLASVAHVICMVGREKEKDDHGPDSLVRDLGSAMQRWPGFRGPRSAVMSAIMGAGIVLDDRDAQLKFPEVIRSWGASGGSTSGGGSGVVATVKAAGKKTTVSFKKVTVKETRCTQSKTTNRISHVLPDGTFVYYHNCLKYGLVTIDKTADDQTVNSQYAEGLKPGVQAEITEDVVYATRAKPSDKVPATVFGVRLK